MSDSWSLRIDFTGIHAKPAKENIKDNGNTVTTNSLFSNYDFAVGLNYSF